MVVNSETNSQSKVVEKFSLYSTGFAIFHKIEALYFANMSCCISPIELKFGEHLDDEIWNNFGIQLVAQN